MQQERLHPSATKMQPEATYSDQNILGTRVEGKYGLTESFPPATARTPHPALAETPLRTDGRPDGRSRPAPTGDTPLPAPRRRARGGQLVPAQTNPAGRRPAPAAASAGRAAPRPRGAVGGVHSRRTPKTVTRPRGAGGGARRADPAAGTDGTLHFAPPLPAPPRAGPGGGVPPCKAPAVRPRRTLPPPPHPPPPLAEAATGRARHEPGAPLPGSGGGEESGGASSPLRAPCHFGTIEAGAGGGASRGSGGKTNTQRGLSGTRSPSVETAGGRARRTPALAPPPCCQAGRFGSLLHLTSPQGPTGRE